MIKVIGTGSYLPSKIMTNLDLEKMVNTSDHGLKIEQEFLKEE